MSTHTVVLFNRKGAALANSYPSSLNADERIVYDIGGSRQHPLQVSVTKSTLGGANVVVKVQGAPLPVDGACFATRGPGGEQGLLQVFAKTGELYTVQLVQRVGNGLGFQTTIVGTVGVDAKLVLGLPTNPIGLPSGTPQAAADVINGLSDFSAIASGAGASIGILGETLDARPACRIHWDDIPSDLEGTVAVEHTINAPAGTTVDKAIVVMARNFLAIRALAKSAAAEEAGTDDAVLVLAALQGA